LDRLEDIVAAGKILLAEKRQPVQMVEERTVVVFAHHTAVPTVEPVSHHLPYLLEVQDNMVGHPGHFV
jgi:hypothetical protein